MGKYKNLIIKYLKHQVDFWKQELDQSQLYGKQSIPIDQLYHMVHMQAEPVFVLSTGRCGTKLLSNLLEKDRSTVVAHKPAPELTEIAHYAYRWGDQRHDQLKLVIDACRYEMIRDSWLLRKTFIETNNRITYFACQLAELFPKAKFIYLRRDLIGFVASGYSRNWYTYERLPDEGRITPDPKSNIPWTAYTQCEKIAWLWLETNRFIEKSLTQISPDRHIFLESANLYSNPEEVKNLLDFVGVKSISLKEIQKIQSSPVNAQPRSRRKQLTEDQIQQIGDLEEKFNQNSLQ